MLSKMSQRCQETVMSSSGSKLFIMGWNLSEGEIIFSYTFMTRKLLDNYIGTTFIVRIVPFIYSPNKDLNMQIRHWMCINCCKHIFCFVLKTSFYMQNQAVFFHQLSIKTLKSKYNSFK